MKLRVKSRKYGAVRFIGHLDVMRFFQKANRRAGLDVTYTTGFSPHQVMSFAAPLGVGLESNGEYMDLEVNSITDSQDMINRLNQASVPGIEIIAVKLLPDDARNAMATVAAAAYTVRFRSGREPVLDICGRDKDFLAQAEILIEKTTKKGSRTIDLRPGIYEFEVTGEYIRMLVDASSAGNLKPALVIAAFMEYIGEELPENALLITREETYMDSGRPGSLRFAALDSIGSDF